MTTTIRRMASLKALAQALSRSRRPGAPGVRDRLAAVPRMLSMGLSGRYPYLDRSRMAMAALALLYVISPVDLMPEVILPLIGLGDDAFVAAWLAGAVLSETDTFLAWEKATGDGDVDVVVGEVVD
jgi:uncharacterized membrane protein YkvA (DUF1232 family)